MNFVDFAIYLNVVACVCIHLSMMYLLVLCLVLFSAVSAFDRISPISCCDYTSSLQLLQCVQNSSSKLLQHHLSTIPYLSNKLGPRLSVVQITRATSNISPYAAPALFLQSVFAERNGYGLYISTNDTIRNDFQLYPKLSILLELLHQYKMMLDL